MAARKYLIALTLVWAWISFAPGALAISSRNSLTVAYSAFSGAYVPLWIAFEKKLGNKYGLDLKIVYAGRIRPQQLLVSGEAPFVVATGSGALTSHVLGVKDQVIIASFMNNVGASLFSQPEITTPEQLKGKIIGAGRPGAFGDIMVRYVLDQKLGLIPDKDVKVLPIGNPALTLQALERGVVNAASLSMPANLIARKMGFHELADYDQLGVVYPYNTVTTLRQTLDKNSQLAEKLLKTLIEAVSIYKTDRETSLKVMKKYMKGANLEILQQTYDYFSSRSERLPEPSVQVIKGALDIVAVQFPQAKQTDPNEIIDGSIVKRIEQSGFIEGLYNHGGG